MLDGFSFTGEKKNCIYQDGRSLASLVPILLLHQDHFVLTNTLANLGSCNLRQSICKTKRVLIW